MYNYKQVTISDIQKMNSEMKMIIDRDDFNYGRVFRNISDPEDYRFLTEYEDFEYDPRTKEYLDKDDPNNKLSLEERLIWVPSDEEKNSYIEKKISNLRWIEDADRIRDRYTIIYNKLFALGKPWLSLGENWAGCIYHTYNNYGITIKDKNKYMNVFNEYFEYLKGFNKINPYPYALSLLDSNKNFMSLTFEADMNLSQYKSMEFNDYVNKIEEIYDNIIAVVDKIYNALEKVAGGNND